MKIRHVALPGVQIDILHEDAKLLARALGVMIERVESFDMWDQNGKVREFYLELDKVLRP